VVISSIGSEQVGVVSVRRPMWDGVVATAARAAAALPIRRGIDSVQSPCRSLLSHRPGQSIALRDHRVVRVRPVQPADVTKLLDLYTALSPESRYRRYFTASGLKSRRDAERVATAVGAGDLVLVAVSEQRPERIAAVAQLAAAEIALTVLDDYQDVGLGSVLLDLLLAAARQRGLCTVEATALAGNSRVLRMLRRRHAKLGEQGAGVLHATLSTEPYEAESGLG
jgi:GNAT superfamily N-acetyltransferase